MAKVQRVWTDAELGFIADHPDWTDRQIGDHMGRSKMAVWHKRTAVERGWSPTYAMWTAEEDEFILATRHLTAAQVADHLGRTTSGVEHRRQQIRPFPEYFAETNKNPWHVGARPLLCRTCPDYGRLLAGKWFHRPEGRFNYRCTRCWQARQGPRDRQANAERRAEQNRANLDRYQRITRATATKHGEEWTTSDYDVLADPDLTVLEKAIRLGRTWAACQTRCSMNGFTSHIGLGDPTRDEWTIENPRDAQMRNATA